MPLHQFAFPPPIFPQNGVNLLERLGKNCREKLVNDRANGFLMPPPVKLLASPSPAADHAIEVMDDDIGTVKNMGDFVKTVAIGHLGLYCIGHQAGLVKDWVS